MTSKPENANLVEMNKYILNMVEMIKNIEFRKKVYLQNKLMSDIKKINERNELIIPADKSKNYISCRTMITTNM